MDQNALFRKSALDKLASPERLDVLMTVTSPRAWVSLCTVVGLLGGLLAWSAWGSIPTRVEGNGILIRGGSLREIRAVSGGILVELSIKNGSNVGTDMHIGKIAQPASDENVRAAEDAYRAAQSRYESNQADDRANIIRNQGQIDVLTADIETTDADIVKAQAELERLQDLLKQGLTTKARVDLQEQKISGLRNTRTSQRGQINSLRVINQIIQKGRADFAQVENLRRQWELARDQRGSDAEIRSTVAGRVVELKKASGDSVRPNDVIATVEQSSTVFTPVVFVDSAIAKKIQRGMEAQISPSTVKREEFGFLRAVVADVGRYPVAPDRVIEVVGNSDLARELLGKTSKIEVRFELIGDNRTPSGYAWSSSSGPPFEIDGGTKLNAAVVVERRKPYNYVLPMIKGAIGAS